MRTVAVDQAVMAAAISVENEVLAHQANGLDGIAVKLAGAPDRLPIAAQQRAHRGAGPDAGEHVIASDGEHFLSLRLLGLGVAGDYSIFCPQPGEEKSTDSRSFCARALT
jgi:hypothetical protein